VLDSSNGQGRRILVGGTASIRGEESLHLGSLSDQTAETFENLAHLIKAANGAMVDPPADLSPAETRQWLGQFRDLRIYYVREIDREFLVKRVAEFFPQDCRVEFLRANLCRAELLVEIEGLAQARC
jgi:chorismate lyase/3-hydroxybenzoate synthase